MPKLHVVSLIVTFIVRSSSSDSEDPKEKMSRGAGMLVANNVVGLMKSYTFAF